MKKLLFALFGTLSLSLGAQISETEKTTSQVHNDIMISPIELIAGPTLNISYERLINEDSGVGINGIFLLDNEGNNFSQFSPYYRMYFGKKYAAGFFVEGFVPITSTKDELYHYSQTGSYYTNENNTTFGIGVGFGGKWIAKKNIIFEASMGVGRRFGNNNELGIDVITGKGMLGIGYRF